MTKLRQNRLLSQGFILSLYLSLCRYSYGQFVEINSHSLFSKWFSEVHPAVSVLKNIGGWGILKLYVRCNIFPIPMCLCSAEIPLLSQHIGKSPYGNSELIVVPFVHRVANWSQRCFRKSNS